jgi:hypothetical protein
MGVVSRVDRDVQVVGLDVGLLYIVKGPRTAIARAQERSVGARGRHARASLTPDVRDPLCRAGRADVVAQKLVRPTVAVAVAVAIAVAITITITVAVAIAVTVAVAIAVAVAVAVAGLCRFTGVRSILGIEIVTTA